HQKQPPAKMAVFVSARAVSAVPQSVMASNVNERDLNMVPVTRDPADQLFHRQLPPTDPMTDANSVGASPASGFELIPANYFAPLDLARVFPRVAPLEIDLGCGDGAFLVAMAERFPE